MNNFETIGDRSSRHEGTVFPMDANQIGWSKCAGGLRIGLTFWQAPITNKQT